MNVEEIREYCIAKAGVTEHFPFDEDTLVFKANGKMFLLISMTASPVQFNVKCDPEKAELLREEHQAIIPGYHMSKKHWNTVVCDGSLSTSMPKEQIDHSYELITSKKTKRKKGDI